MVQPEKQLSVFFHFQRRGSGAAGCAELSQGNSGTKTKTVHTLMLSIGVRLKVSGLFLVDI